jgi:thiamine-phosphate pyrophosphorylase
LSSAPRVYIITDRHACHGRPLVEVVRAALSGAPPGTVAVQLREKDLEGHALAALARELRAVTADAGAALYVNDRVDVALAVGADGVHLGGRSLSAADVARVAPDLGVAISAHAPDEIVRAAAAHPQVRFAVFGPVFDTPSKRAYGQPLGLEALGAAAVRAHPLPVLALGGVSPDRARACRQAGAAGVAAIRALMAAADPRVAIAGFLQEFAVPVTMPPPGT